MQVIKDGLLRVGEMMCEEFSGVREEIKDMGGRQEFGIMSRWNQMESQLNQLTTDHMHLRLTLDQKLDCVRALVEEDLRKELDRQKTLWHSFMSE